MGGPSGKLARETGVMLTVVLLDRRPERYPVAIRPSPYHAAAGTDCLRADCTGTTWTGMTTSGRR